MARTKSSAELKLQHKIDDLLEEKQQAIIAADEWRARAAAAEVGDSSGLTDILPPQEAEVVELAETVMARSLTAREAYFLGRMVQGFGPQRCANAIGRKRTAREPIRAAYAMLNAGAMGAVAREKDVAEPTSGYAALDGYEYE